MRLNPMARIRREHAAAIADMKTLEALSKAVGPSAGLSQRELEQRGLVGAARRLMTSDSVRQHHARFVITGAGRKRLLDPAPQAD